MGAAEDRTRETLPEVASESESAAHDTEHVSAVREVARREPPLLEAAGATAAGTARSLNQDAFGVWLDHGLCVVADGMGGRPAGDVAAKLAVAEIGCFFLESDPDKTPPMALDVTRGLAAGLLARALEHASAAVHAAGLRQSAWRGMGAAAAALLVAGPRVAVAHVGDVRVYRVRGGGLEKLTEDHSQAQEYLKLRGEVADPDILRLYRRILTQALGATPAVRVTVSVEVIQPGDAFLLCSDGLWGSLPHETMARILAAAPTVEEAAAALVATARETGARDDATAVLARPLRQGAASKPLAASAAEAVKAVPRQAAARLGRRFRRGRRWAAAVRVLGRRGEVA